MLDAKNSVYLFDFSCLYTGCAIKSNPPDLLAVFSATAGNFNANFFTHLFIMYLHAGINSI